MHKKYREKCCHFIYLNIDELVDKVPKHPTTLTNTHKTVVNNYALSILVLRSQYYLLKELALIASRTLTVTDPQPNKIHFDRTQPKLDHYPSPGFPLIL
jgi:hypothetical protein